MIEITKPRQKFVLPIKHRNKCDTLNISCIFGYYVHLKKSHKCIKLLSLYHTLNISCIFDYYVHLKKSHKYMKLHQSKNNTELFKERYKSKYEAEETIS